MSSAERASAAPIHLDAAREPGEHAAGTQSIEALYEAHRSTLLAYLATIMGSMEDAKEIYHEACGKLLDLKPAALSLPVGYLWRTAQNLARDYQRKRAIRRRLDPIALFNAAQQFPSAESWLEARQRLALVKQALGELSPQRRVAFMRRVVDGLSFKEVANEMGVSVRMVKYHVASALEHCHRLIKREESPHPRTRKDLGCTDAPAGPGLSAHRSAAPTQESSLARTTSVPAGA
jgi:RNA polymerase sigma factor (sigma-70 family)